MNGWPVAVERHEPGEPAGRDLAAEMHLDVVGPANGSLELRALHERPRHAETELTVEAIVRAARQRRMRARRIGWPIVDGDATTLRRVDGDRSDARAGCAARRRPARLESASA